MLQAENRTLRFLLLAFAVLTPLLACVEYPGVPREVGLGTVGQLPPAVSGSTGSTDSASEEASFGREVQLELRDFELVPADITVAAGGITFTLVNAGRFTHDFRVEGEGIDEKSPRVAAGRTDEWSITLAPGVYHISCPISNHADRGMVGTMTVVPND